jgi:hypothetical protein
MWSNLKWGVRESYSSYINTSIKHYTTVNSTRKNLKSITTLLTRARKTSFNSYLLASLIFKATPIEHSCNIGLVTSRVLRCHEELWSLTGQRKTIKAPLAPAKLSGSLNVPESPTNWDSPTVTSSTVNSNDRIRPDNPSLLLRSLLQYDSNGKCVNAFKILHRKEILELAYETIKSKPGNMVRGTDKKTLDGITPDWFQNASLNLLRESYQPYLHDGYTSPKPMENIALQLPPWQNSSTSYANSNGRSLGTQVPWMFPWISPSTWVPFRPSLG